VLVRIDARDGSVKARVTVGRRILQEEGSVGAGEGGIWVLTVSPHPTLYKVDPRTNRVVGSYPAPDQSAAVRAGLGHVWITDTINDNLLALDPRNGHVTKRVKVGPGARFVAVGEGAVWVLNQSDGSVTQVDPTSLKVVRKVVVSEQPVDGGDIAVGGGYVWARVSDALVAQIDPNTGTVKARYGTPAGSGSVAADDNSLWITAHDVDSVWRVPLH
jgi:virginiamycin B lyase